MNRNEVLSAFLKCVIKSLSVYPGSVTPVHAVNSPGLGSASGWLGSTCLPGAISE